MQLLRPPGTSTAPQNPVARCGFREDELSSLTYSEQRLTYRVRYIIYTERNRAAPRSPNAP